MLIRSQNGSTFHVVSRETRKYYFCLCGEQIFKNCGGKQGFAIGNYSRCEACRRLEIEGLRRSGLKVYELREEHLPVLRRFRRRVRKF